MQAIRLVRPRANIQRQFTRSLAAAVNASTVTSSSRPAEPVIPLSSVEAQWEKLTTEEQQTIHLQLEEIQKKDWKTLTLDEKKAAYYVAFGPHGPRAALHPPGSTLQIMLGTAGFVALGGLLFLTARYLGQETPKTMSKEWQEASNARAIEMKLDPINGISSEGYSGKGFVTSK